MSEPNDREALLLALAQAQADVENLRIALQVSSRDNDRLRGTNAALEDEVDRLKANLPKGGEWVVEYGQRNLDFDGEVDFWTPPHRVPSHHDDVKRDVWLGPAEPIRPVDDSTQPPAPRAVADDVARTDPAEGHAPHVGVPEAHSASQGFAREEAR